jgi:ParB family chromosome partitioning protein
MKKADMAEAAEQLIAGTGWLPAVLRMAESEDDALSNTIAADEQPTDAVEPELENEAAYSIAAE